MDYNPKENLSENSLPESLQKQQFRKLVYKWRTVMN